MSQQLMSNLNQSGQKLMQQIKSPLPPPPSLFPPQQQPQPQQPQQQQSTGFMPFSFGKTQPQPQQPQQPPQQTTMSRFNSFAKTAPAQQAPASTGLMSFMPLKKDDKKKKQFREYLGMKRKEPKSGLIGSILKLYVAMFDKMGATAVDWVGASLGLSKDGVPISEQSMDELTSRMRKLAVELQSPEYLTYLKSSIRSYSEELLPVLRERMTAISQIIAEALSKNAEVLPKMVFDAMSAIPFAGSVVAMGKIANDVTKIVSNVTGTASSVVEEVAEAKEDIGELAEAQQQSLANAPEVPVTQEAVQNVVQEVQQEDAQALAEAKAQQLGGAIRAVKNNSIIRHRVNRSTAKFLLGGRKKVGTRKNRYKKRT